MRKTSRLCLLLILLIPALGTGQPKGKTELEGKTRKNRLGKIREWMWREAYGLLPENRQWIRSKSADSIVFEDFQSPPLALFSPVEANGKALSVRNQAFAREYPGYREAVYDLLLRMIGEIEGKEREKKTAIEELQRAEEDKWKRLGVERDNALREARGKLRKEEGENRAMRSRVAKLRGDSTALSQNLETYKAQMGSTEKELIERAESLEARVKHQNESLRAKTDSLRILNRNLARLTAKLADAEGRASYLRVLALGGGVILLVLLVLLLALYTRLKRSARRLVAQLALEKERLNDERALRDKLEKASAGMAAQFARPASELQKTQEDGRKAFAEYTDSWVVVGASTIGKSHIGAGLPCQDNHFYKYLGGGWGIAVVSDGAGSAKQSHIGSEIVAQRCAFHTEHLLGQGRFFSQRALPSQEAWGKLAFTALRNTRSDLASYAKKHGVEFSELSATVMVLVHCEQGFLSAHIGDGRGGYLEAGEEEWHALFTPHKGEESNATYFITSREWTAAHHQSHNGISIPECRVVECRPGGFCLMSDGCEATAWEYNLRDEGSGNFYDPNRPYDKFFSPIAKQLVDFRQNVTQEECARKWHGFLEKGTPSLASESDDKTLLIGIYPRKK